MQPCRIEELPPGLKEGRLAKLQGKERGPLNNIDTVFVQTYTLVSRVSCR